MYTSKFKFLKMLLKIFGGTKKISEACIILLFCVTVKSEVPAPPDFKVSVVGTFTFTFEWELNANLSYKVLASTLDEEINNCDGGVFAVTSPVLLNQTVKGASIKPDSTYKLAMCAEDGSGNVSSPNVITKRSAYSPSCYSLESSCSFPFQLGGVNRSKCWTTSRITPWCSATSNYDTDYQWVNCTYCQTSGCTSTPKCFFPFTYLGKTYTSCTPIDNEEYNNQPWCALQADLPDVSPINVKWKNCKNCEYNGCEQKTAPCVFPFLYNGQLYDSCIITDDSNNAWCSTTYNFDNDHQWRNCSLYCLEPPKLKATPISMTSLKFDWPPLYWTLNYLIISSGIYNTFPDIIVKRPATTATVSGLLPYTFYDISVVGVGSYPNGSEFRTSAFKQSVLMFTLSYCPESTVLHPKLQTPIIFPRTQAGYKNGSVNTCSNSTLNFGSSLAMRECTIDAIWNDPDWLESCNVTIQAFAGRDNLSEIERQNVATQLFILTFKSSKLTAEKLSQTSSALETLVAVDTLSQMTSNRVVSCLSNLLQSPEEELAASGVSDSLLATLEEVTTKVTLDSDGKFHYTESRLSVETVGINKSESESNGIVYQENYNPSSLLMGFSKQQFVVKSINSEVPKNNYTSSISVPPEVLHRSKDDRLRFFAFFNPSVFQVSPKRNQFYNHAISPNSTVQSNSILSASVDEKISNLNETVKMKFQFTQVTCPSERTDGSCGDYLCGFWNETDSFWSTNGCSMVSVTQNYIECECDHLTNFATLFAYGNSTWVREDDVLKYLTIVCCSISFSAALLTIFCLVLLRRWKDAGISNRTTIVMINLSVALIILNGMLLISSRNNFSSGSCTAIAILLHFGLLSTVMWCLVEASYVCLAIVKPIYYQTGISSKKLLLFALPLGWGLPAFFVLINVGVNLPAYGGGDGGSSNICWIVPDMIAEIVIAPCSVILFAILVIYVVTIRKFLTKKKIGETGKAHSVSKGKNLVLSMSLFLMFGITWIIGFTLFDSNSYSLVAAYVFTITNSLQGLILFLLFVVRNEKIRLAMRKRVESLTASEKTRNSSFGGGKSFKS